MSIRIRSSARSIYDGEKYEKLDADDLVEEPVDQLINALRELDYLDGDDSVLAYELHKVLGDITRGINAGFQDTLQGEEVGLAAAHKNGRAVKGWQGFWEQHSDKAEFDEWVKKRRQKD